MFLHLTGFEQKLIDDAENFNQDHATYKNCFTAKPDKTFFPPPTRGCEHKYFVLI